MKPGKLISRELSKIFAFCGCCGENGGKESENLASCLLSVVLIPIRNV